ncbi:hypothetical protein D3C75_1312480 [compost metagenome]
MSNYIVLHTPSQLIKAVITSSKAPKPDNEHTFHNASITVLEKYYKLKSKKSRNGTLVSSGELAAVSPSFLDSLG